MIGCQAPLDFKLIINRSHNVTDERSIFRDQLTKKFPNSLLCWPQNLHHHITKGRTKTYTICGRDRRLCVDKSLTWLYTNVNFFARLVNDLLPNWNNYLQWIFKAYFVFKRCSFSWRFEWYAFRCGWITLTDVIEENVNENKGKGK